MPLHDVDLLKCHSALDDAGVLAEADGHALPLLERIERLVAERDHLIFASCDLDGWLQFRTCFGADDLRTIDRIVRDGRHGAERFTLLAHRDQQHPTSQGDDQ